MNENCDICLDDLSEILKKNEFEYLLQCNSCIFKGCSSCMKKWYKKEKTCPQCRKFRSFDVEIEEDDGGPIDFNNVRDINELLQLLYGGLEPVPLPFPINQENPPNPPIVPNQPGQAEPVIYNGDRTKVFNSRTHRWVKIAGKIGRNIINAIRQ